MIFDIPGLATDRARAEEAERIVNWAFREFSMKTFLPKGEAVIEAPVWLGTSRKVALTTPDGLRVLVPAGAEDQVRAEAVFEGPLQAPIAAGDRLGELVVTIPGGATARTPLIAATDVPEAGFFGRLQGAVWRLGSRAYQEAQGG